MYAIPPYRFLSYVTGVFMGYVLRNNTPVTLMPRTLKLGWIVAFLGLFTTSYISVLNNNRFDPMLMALFAAVAPLTLCIFFAWIIFVSHCGAKSKLSTWCSLVVCL
jgi:uncharacterized membrane protein